MAEKPGGWRGPNCDGEDQATGDIIDNTINDIFEAFLDKKIPESEGTESLFRNYRNALIFETTREVLKKPSNIVEQRDAATIQKHVDELVGRKLGEDN